MGKLSRLAPAGLIAGFFAMLAAGVGGFAWALIFELSRNGLPGRWSVLGLLGLALCIRGVIYLAGSGRAAGVPVAPEEEPGLWSSIGEVCTRLGCAVPDRVLLVPEARVSLLERRVLVVWPRRRDLLVGMVLLTQLSVGELRACLAGELARLPAPGQESWWLVRIHAFLDRVIRGSGQLWPALPFDWWALLFRQATREAYRAAEKPLASRTAAVVGEKLWLRSQRGLARTGTDFSFFVRREILPLLLAGGLPENLYEGYRIWLSRPRGKNGEPLDSKDLPPEATQLETASGDETAPPQQQAPESTTPDWNDPAPAQGLLGVPDRREREVTPFLVEMFRRQGIHDLKAKPQLVPWAQVEGKLVVPLQRTRAEQTLQALRAIARDSLALEEGIGFYLGLLSLPEDRLRLAGRLDPNLARFPSILFPQLVRGIHTRHLGTLVGNALVERRGYHWQKGIGEPLVVVGLTGERLDPFLLSRDLLDGNLDIGQFRMVLFEHGLFGQR